MPGGLALQPGSMVGTSLDRPPDSAGQPTQAVPRSAGVMAPPPARPRADACPCLRFPGPQVVLGTPGGDRSQVGVSTASVEQGHSFVTGPPRRSPRHSDSGSGSRSRSMSSMPPICGEKGVGGCSPGVPPPILAPPPPTSLEQRAAPAAANPPTPHPRLSPFFSVFSFWLGAEGRGSPQRPQPGWGRGPR